VTAGGEAGVEPSRGPVPMYVPVATPISVTLATMMVRWRASSPPRAAAG
jgi:hypothetical protein